MSNIQFDSLETERLILRKFQESDAPAFLEYRTNPQVALYQSEKWLDFTLEDAVQFVREQRDFEPGLPDTWFQIAIELKETGNLIGDLAIHTLAQDIKQVEIGYTLSPLYQKKGYGIEAVRCLLGYLFDVLNKHRVIAITDARNKPSIELLEKVGMRKEGHFIKCTWDKGEYTDEYSYALLKEEWQRKTIPPIFPLT